MWLIVFLVALAFALVPIADALLWLWRDGRAEREAREWHERNSA
jgi:hypothetical protein